MTHDSQCEMLGGFHGCMCLDRLKPLTPRTSTHLRANTGNGNQYVSADFARILERESAELLEALETLNLIIGLTPIAGNKDALQDACDIAREAIAKAKGETK